MSRVTRLKHVQRELDSDDFSLPTEKQQICRIVSSKGNNLHEVESSIESEENYLVSMPPKFRKNVWIKRGDFVLVEPIEEGDKVKAEICRILTPEHQKEFEKAFVWPKKFTKKRDHEEIEDDKTSDSDSDNDDDLPQNPNRRQNYRAETSSSEESDQED
ncbi:probable RNA-binding protein EIF1AD [Chironomus tepperi]|uniref:probable RNA-binding protein EIF1AD n=1 Tax=Chironomus tepperi TaxID=113505 RepID=UPI00391FA5B4